MSTSLLAAHVLMDERSKDELNHVPLKKWSQLRFDVIDILYVSPFAVISKEGAFGLAGTRNDPNGNNVRDCFEALVKLTRSRNPGIKIIAMQFFGTGPDGDDFSVLDSPALRENYAKSVAAFLQEWHDKKTTRAPNDPTVVSLRVDGYDVDYEWAPSAGFDSTTGNQQPWASEVLALIREKVDTLSKQLQISPFTVSITPASVTNIQNDGYPFQRAGVDKKLTDLLDYVSMQNYSGGLATDPTQYATRLPNLGRKLFYGVCVEGTTTENGENTNFQVGSVDDIKRRVSEMNLGGVMVWRMNSDNWVFENMVLVALHNRFHGLTSQKDLESNITKSWKFAGRDFIWPTQTGLPTPKPVSPCTEDDWKHAVYGQNLPQ